jgi:hypothetical protein
MNQARLKELLHYCPLTGVFTWRSTGKITGCITRYGYLETQLDKRRYRLHRLAWLYVYGKWPIDCIDHKNRVRTDNTIENLREATRAQNRQNLTLDTRNKSGVRGVSFDFLNKKWRASISINGKTKNLGRYKLKEDAAKAYKKAASVYHTHNMEAV